MKRARLIFVLSSLCAAVVVGCTDPEASGPPVLRLGEDVCADCGMSIIEAKYAAAALVVVDGRREHAVFDDVGCMVYWQEQHATTEILERWSGVVDRDGWVSVRDGIFVVGSSVRTPMDFHILCCSTREHANTMVKESGGAITPFDAVRPITQQPPSD